VADDHGRRSDFIKGHLLYSEEFETRRNDPAYYGHRGLDPKVLRSIVDRAHADHLRVSCHIETAVDFRNALAAGVDEINHMPGYFPTPEHQEWFPITAQDAALAARQGVVVVTTTYVAAAEMARPEEAAQLKTARQIQAGIWGCCATRASRSRSAPTFTASPALAEALNVHTLNVLDNRALLKAWCETTAGTILPEAEDRASPGRIRGELPGPGRRPAGRFREGEGHPDALQAGPPHPGLGSWAIIRRHSR